MTSWLAAVIDKRPQQGWRYRDAPLPDQAGFPAL